MSRQLQPSAARGEMDPRDKPKDDMSDWRWPRSYFNASLLFFTRSALTYTCPPNAVMPGLVLGIHPSACSGAR